MHVHPLPVLCGSLVLALASTMPAQNPSQPEGERVCVAIVGNSSTTSAFVERLTERLTTTLKKWNKVNAVAMKSRTRSKYPLQLSTDNGKEAKHKNCDYVLLSQIRDPRQHPLDPHAPVISIGGPVPGTDATDSGTVYHTSFQIAFALFRMGRFAPVVDTYVLEGDSANVSDRFLPAMDREADRIASELHKDRQPE